MADAQSTTNAQSAKAVRVSDDRLKASITLLASMSQRNKLPSDGRGVYMSDGMLRPALGVDDVLRANDLLSLLEELQELRSRTAKEPPPGLLMSMAIRFDHGLGCPGFYDQPIYTHGGHISHQDRLESTLRVMGQLYEEMSGNGFYKLP